MFSFEFIIASHFSHETLEFICNLSWSLHAIINLVDQISSACILWRLTDVPLCQLEFIYSLFDVIPSNQTPGSEFPTTAISRRCLDIEWPGCIFPWIDYWQHMYTWTIRYTSWCSKFKLLSSHGSVMIHFMAKLRLCLYFSSL